MRCFLPVRLRRPPMVRKKRADPAAVPPEGSLGGSPNALFHFPLYGNQQIENLPSAVSAHTGCSVRKRMVISGPSPGDFCQIVFRYKMKDTILCTIVHKYLPGMNGINSNGDPEMRLARFIRPENSAAGPFPEDGSGIGSNPPAYTGSGVPGKKTRTGA